MSIFNSLRFLINKHKSYREMKIKTTKEIHSMKMEIQELYLKHDREENEAMANLYKAQLDVFKWVLGEK